MVDWKSIQGIAEDILYNDKDNGNDDDDDDKEDTINREIMGEEVAATTHSFPHSNYRQYVQRGGAGVGYYNNDDRTVLGEVRSFCC